MTLFSKLAECFSAFKSYLFGKYSDFAICLSCSFSAGLVRLGNQLLFSDLFVMGYYLIGMPVLHLQIRQVFNQYFGWCLSISTASSVIMSYFKVLWILPRDLVSCSNKYFSKSILRFWMAHLHLIFLSISKFLDQGLFWIICFHIPATILKMKVSFLDLVDVNLKTQEF